MIREIATAVAVQFGPHFAKNIASLKLLFSSDPGWHIGAAEWGFLQTAVTIPCGIFPWLIGQSVDSKVPVKSVLIAALIFTCVGQGIFMIACKDKLFDFALLGRFVFGVGEGLTSALPGFIAVRYVPDNRMFAIGLTQSFHALSVALSKATQVPASRWYGDYVGGLGLALLLCMGSLGVVLLWKPPAARPLLLDETCSSPRRNRLKICCQAGPGRLSIDFWIVAGMHMLMSSAHRLFGHVDAALLSERFDQTATVAGYYSSITEFVAVFIAPCLGAYLDRYRSIKTLPLLLLVASISGAAGYALLSFATSTVILQFALILIGCVNGMSPTVMRSVVPETIHESVIATAFGIYESAESVGVIIGSILIGVLAERTGGKYSHCVPLFPILLSLACILAISLLARRRKIDRPSPVINDGDYHIITSTTL